MFVMDAAVGILEQRPKVASFIITAVALILKAARALARRGSSTRIAYVAEMRRRLVAKQIGAKREFLKEVINEVRVRGNDIALTSKLPLRASEGWFLHHLNWWAHLDSNQGPTGYEPVALTN
jgi:hypothetical protein